MKGIHNLVGINPGDLYTTDGKDVWRVVSMCDLPTITLERLYSPESQEPFRRGGAIGSLNVADFARLKPECDVS